MRDFPPKTKWKSLLGFFSETDALNIVKSQGILLSSDQEEALTRDVRRSVEHVKILQGRRDLAPKIGEIPAAAFKKRREDLENEPTFKEHLVGIDDYTFALVEPQNLHAFQPHLNLEYVNRLKDTAPSLGDIEGLIKFCLPLKTEIAKSGALTNFNQNTNTFTVTSENLDLRIIGQVQGEEPNSGRNFFGFAYGSGLHQMSVTEFKGIYMIKNGYHRAYALLERGHKVFPCLLLKTNNYNATGAAALGFFNADLVVSDKSPLLSDFSTPAAVTYERRLTRVIVSVHAELQVIPL